jgi:hypothetical protein
MAENQKAYTHAQRWERGAREECGVHAKKRAWRIRKSEKEQEQILKMHKIKAITKRFILFYFLFFLKECERTNARVRPRSMKEQKQELETRNGRWTKNRMSSNVKQECEGEQAPKDKIVPQRKKS